MIARMSQCDRRRLELALEGRLLEGQAEELSQHLQACEHCRVELEQMAAGQECWEDMRHLRAADQMVTSGDESSAATSSEATPESATNQEGEEPLDFLTPSDKPDSLGRLGDYEIEKVIGRGGMGIVLKAHDPSLNRIVAIKVMVGHLAASAAARKRFAREAQAAAAVVHDHVIPIYAVDISGQTPFLVMPYIAGRSLQDRLDGRGVLEIKEVLRIALQMAKGLAAAHAQGLIHRDIKPANILLENDVERVRITDFGLARAIDDASQTQSGFIAGTPQYMAPEQARGEPIDARADLFSLGTVMYAMCTGHSPFRADTTLAVLRRVCDDTPRRIGEINTDVPQWLSDIIEGLLAKFPANRFQSADEVATLLESWLAHHQQPTVVPRPQLPRRNHGHRRMGGRQWLLAIGGVGIAATVGLLAWTFWTWRPNESREPQTAWSSNSDKEWSSESDKKWNSSSTKASGEDWPIDRAKSLQGKWKVAAVQAPDKELSIGDQFTFSGDNRLAVNKQHLETSHVLSATFRVHGSQGRSTIDVTFDDGSTWLGLYEVDGNRLRISFGQPGGERPTKLGTAGADWVFVFVELQRQEW